MIPIGPTGRDKIAQVEGSLWRPQAWEKVKFRIRAVSAGQPLSRPCRALARSGGNPGRRSFLAFPWATLSRPVGPMESIIADSIRISNLWVKPRQEPRPPGNAARTRPSVAWIEAQTSPKIGPPKAVVDRSLFHAPAVRTMKMSPGGGGTTCGSRRLRIISAGATGEGRSSLQP